MAFKSPALVGSRKPFLFHKQKMTKSRIIVHNEGPSLRTLLSAIDQARTQFMLKINTANG